MPKAEHVPPVEANTDARPLARVTTTFEGVALTSYMFRDALAWIAQDAGKLIGYDPGAFRKALVNWSDELVDGHDLEVLKGDDLREFKAILDGSVKTTLASVSQLTILREPGLYQVCQKTHLPLGVKLRRHLADEVLPRLVRGETIRGNDAPPLTKADVESIADAAVARALAKVREGDMPTLRPGDEQRLGRGIGEGSADLYIREPLREIAKLKARAIGNDRNPSVVSSIRLIVEHELRRIVSHPSQLSWDKLPIFMLDEASNALARMRAEALNLATNSGFVRGPNGNWVPSDVNAKQGELYTKAEMGSRRGRRRRRILEEAASRSGDDTLFNGPRKPGNAH
jgi:prophage antirepressor-like protein